MSLESVQTSIKNKSSDNKLINNPLNYGYIKNKEITEVKDIPDLPITDSENSDIDSESESEKSANPNKSNKFDRNINKIDLDNSDSEEEIEKLIDIKFVSFRKYCFPNNKEIWRPKKVQYAGKILYLIIS